MRDTGYCFVPRLLDDAATVWLRAAIDELGVCAAREVAAPTPRLVVVAEARDRTQVCRYEHIRVVHPRLAERLCSILSPMLDDTCDRHMLLFKDKVNNKYPGGGGYRAHQDIVAYRSFGPRYHVTAMIAIDAADENNGCLQIAEGYREVAERHPQAVAELIDGLPVFRYTWGDAGSHGDIVDDVAARFAWRPVPAAPGDVLLFDSFLPHYSKPNHSTRARRAMFLTFTSEEYGDWYERYYREKLANPLDPRFHVSTPTRF